MSFLQSEPNVLVPASSGGPIAGIVILVLVLIALIGFGVFAKVKGILCFAGKARNNFLSPFYVLLIFKMICPILSVMGQISWIGPLSKLQFTQDLKHFCWRRWETSGQSYNHFSIVNYNRRGFIRLATGHSCLCAWLAVSYLLIMMCSKFF